MLARAIWHISPLKSVIKENELFEIQPGELLIRSMFSLVSAGTERLVCTGIVPPELWSDMSVPYMEGSFGFPLKYGYSLVGRVIGGTDEFLGRAVHLMHPHQNYAVCSSRDVCILPDDIPPRRAVIASNMETAVNAVWDSGISMGDNVLIAGFGMIGGLTGILMKGIPGVNVFVSDTDDARLSIAGDLGFLIYPGCCPDSGRFDIAVNASGNHEGLQLCIDKAGTESRILELSWYGDRPVTIKLGGDFHRSRKKIISSQVSSIPANKLNMWSFDRRKRLVFDMLKDDVFDRFLTRDVAFEEAPFIYEEIRQNINGHGIVINY